MFANPHHEVRPAVAGALRVPTSSVSHARAHPRSGAQSRVIPVTTPVGLVAKVVIF